MLTIVLWPVFPAYGTPVMAVSDSDFFATPLALRDALLPLPTDLKEIWERRLLMILSGDQPWNNGRSTGRQAATRAMPISSMPQNMRMLTIPVRVSRFFSKLDELNHTNVVVGRHTTHFRMGKHYSIPRQFPMYGTNGSTYTLGQGLHQRGPCG